MSSFDHEFRGRATAASPQQTESATAGANWGDYAMSVAKIVGFAFAGAILDAVIKGATGAETNFQETAQLGSTVWYVFGPGSPEDRAKRRSNRANRDKHPTPAAPA